MWSADVDAVANALWGICVRIVLTEESTVNLYHGLVNAQTFNDAITLQNGITFTGLTPKHRTI